MSEQRHAPHGSPLPRATPISFPEGRPVQQPTPVRHAPQQHQPPHPQHQHAQAHPHVSRAQPVPVPQQAEEEPALELEPDPEPVPVPVDADDDSIALIDDENASSEQQRRMKSIRALGVRDVDHQEHQRKRQLNATGRGPVRVKTFHAKLSDQGLEYLDNAINDWIDAHPEVDVKFVTSTVGLFDGKFKDLALILNVWY